MADLTRTSKALIDAGVPITALLSPEHGLNGSVQAGETEDSDFDPVTRLPVLNTYLKTGEALDQLIAGHDIDTIVFDMQDVGARTFTYVSSMYDALQCASRLGLKFVVLDRPNPLGGRVTEGPNLDEDFHSFVGRTDIRLRHGLTVGELARLIVSRDLAAQGLHVDLDVVAMKNWDPAGDWDATGLPWVPPSPNVPTVDAGYAFCGTVLFEGTNVSEGRGTTHPFEELGAPWIDGRLAEYMRGLRLPGVMFRDTWFVPTFHKYAGIGLRGVQVHITDRMSFKPVTTALSMIDALAELYPRDFVFLAPRDDSDFRGKYTIDVLWGSDSLRKAVQSGTGALTLEYDPGFTSNQYDSTVLLYAR